MALLDAFLSTIPVEALAVRMLTTALVVMAVSWAVGVFGPIIGGALAGLPIVLGPGFYFLAAQAPASFVSQAATYALFSLCATQCFVLAYIAMANRLSPWTCLMSVVGVWVLATFAFQLAPGQVHVGIILFIVTTALCWHLGRRFLSSTNSAKGKTGWGLLAARGLLAGALVAVVTSASQTLGATGAGLLMAFPIGYSVVAVTIHQRFGSASLIATLHSALLGTSSLAGFCAVVALAVPHWPINVALGSALITSVLITSGLVLRRHLMAARR
ncbi:hypothetical protein FXN63_25870 [Pigmentiphaga aceris]|uniref:Uncharacterized protein n=1 Tax=Pigmentiphaga aceris TaxID=1940612 RepID=A0A5C0B774_9BURK|nr:hypothetical protein [Pigmentiphaga aceris]QEI08901.1 hypothetical protein FXN63_25870 [Pigmentiphaga aceris]